jgi:hypothetical protein
VTADDFPRDSRDAETADDVRARAIEAGALALYELAGYAGRKPNWHSADAEHLEAATVVDAATTIIEGGYARRWEAQVRADERDQKMAAADIAFLDAVDARERLERLRAQVQALLDTVPLHEGGSLALMNSAQRAAYNRVLALLDGEDGECTYCGGVGCKACDARVALLDGEPND